MYLSIEALKKQLTNTASMPDDAAQLEVVHCCRTYIINGVEKKVCQNFPGSQCPPGWHEE